ncbi:MAG: D-alanyl-D-alanine carboxypeptidase (penicillin-binding protein 5/6) [Candidatus Paceibacteria bacterium]|jgi:D-alanyl-D-alanine carboxypeptidase (penicillin-binding protein 5/6)
MTAFVLIGPIIVLIVAFILTKIVVDEKEVPDNINEGFVNTLEVGEDFEDIDIQAMSAYVKELESGKILYAKKANESIPLASLTKMMTALTAIEVLGREGDVVVRKENLDMEGDNGFHINEVFKLKNITDLTLVSSSNDGASAIASAIGSILPTDDNSSVNQMNDFAKRIGMSATRFKNETGLDVDETTPGAKGSAKDMTILMEYILNNYPYLLEATVEPTFNTTSINGFEYEVTNTNNIVGSLPNIVGSKTGYTDLAGGNLAVVINPGLNNPVAIVVLGSTIDGRFDDVDRLAKAVFQYYLSE